MSNAPGVGPSHNPMEITPPQNLPTSSGSTANIGGGSMNNLKQAFIQESGPEEGEKMYNQFLTSMGLSILSMERRSADRAQEAASEMRKQSGS